MPILTAVHSLDQGRGGRRPSSVDAAVADDERSFLPVALMTQGAV